jgi:hypothetical protein
MSSTAHFVFQVSMDVSADKEALFNEVYDTEHVPYLLKVPGVVSVTRTRTVPFQVSIGGETKNLAASTPRYTALYFIESAEVLISDSWCEAVERGRWATQVREHTFNRSHALTEVIN